MPIEMTYRLRTLKEKLKRSKAAEKNFRACKSLFADAARAFILEVVKHVKVDTGMSKASLIPFARRLRVLSQGDFYDVGVPKKTLYEFVSFGSWQKTDPKEYKAAFLGEEAGEGGTAFNFGSVHKPYFWFRFQIRVWQYFLQENGLGHGNHGGPWDSVPSGMRAAEDFMYANKTRYIPADFMQLLDLEDRILIRER